MKIIYEFDPYEDQEDLMIFQKASDYHAALWHIYTLLREIDKHRDGIITENDKIKIWNELLACKIVD